MIEATRSRGRGFVTVYHPNPEASVINGEWPVSVMQGPELI